MATGISITTDDGGATPSSSLAPRPRPQPQATIPLSSVATLGLPTANTARIHLGDKKKSESTLSFLSATAPLERHLHPGYSMFDWTHYTQSAVDLTGVGGQILRVSHEELAKHNTEQDAWTVVRGVVYNITPFMKYHPGGKTQLMRGAGNDCTQLFDKIHVWVNSEAILKKCVVGVYTGAPNTTAAKQVDIPTSSGGEAEKGEEPGVISLTVPDTSLQPSRKAKKEETGVSLTDLHASSQPNRKAEELAGVISLTVPGNSSQTGKESVKWEESTMMSLQVPDKSFQTGKGLEAEKGEVPGKVLPMVTTPKPEYMITTWNSVTGYETSV